MMRTESLNSAARMGLGALDMEGKYCNQKEEGLNLCFMIVACGKWMGQVHLGPRNIVNNLHLQVGWHRLARKLRHREAESNLLFLALMFTALLLFRYDLRAHPLLIS